MKYRQLGKSTLMTSEVAFGCMSLSENHSENARLVSRALELGINLFDTADIYQGGTNEISLGKSLEGKRQQVVISTKVGNQFRKDGNGWDWNPGKQYILAAIDGSLERLRTDYIDLYQLHGGTIDDPIEETIEAFETLKKQGKIRFYGISSIRPNVIREYVSRSDIVSVMIQYSLLDRRPEEYCLNLLQENHIGVLARGALAKGLLVNKPPSNYPEYAETQVYQAAEAVRSLSGSQRTPSQVALQFVVQNPAITSAVVGFRTMSQLEDAAAISKALPLTENEMSFLSACIPVKYYDQHR